MSSAELRAVEKPALKPAHHHGPSAFGDDLRRFVNLTLTLATTDFKLRYFGSALGYLWSLVRPLLFFGVLYVMFTTIGFQLTMRPLLILAIFLMLVGVLIFLIGLLSELVLRSATFGKGYWVRETVNSRSVQGASAAPPTRGGAEEPAKTRLEDQQVK